MLGSFLLIYFYVQGVISVLDFNLPENVQHLVKSCRIGDYVQNDCIKCLCTSKSIFECIPLDCDNTKSVTEIEKSSEEICLPNQLYVQDLVTCICTKDGKWPHKNCQETFQALPPNAVEKHKCDPNSYAVIECNVCWCGPDGEFIRNRCTKNICDEPTRRAGVKTDTVVTKKSVYGNCEANFWYSMAPCQFCYCATKNKLVCNTDNPMPKTLELGSYVLQVCGDNLLTEALELKPEAIALSERAENTSKEKPSTKEGDEKAEVELNRESNENSTNIEEEDNSTDSDEYDQEVERANEEKTAENPADMSATSVNDTALRSNALTDEELESETSDDSKSVSNEIIVDMGDLKTERNDEIATEDSKINTNEGESMNNPRSKDTESVEDFEYVDHTLKINLPNVLSKVFQMALRKSMVTLNKDNECEPGSTTTNGCNVCFCMKNGKMLCTSHEC